MYLPGGITITVQTRAQDAYGDRSTTGTRTVPGCSFAPGNSSEKLDARDEVTENGVLGMPPGDLIGPTDRVVLPDGSVWEVNGTPSGPVNPFSGWAPGVSVPVQRVTG